MMSQGWRRLAGFWTVIAVAGIGSVAALQAMGPPPSPAPKPTPAIVAPGNLPRVLPAPPMPGVIRAPDVALQEPSTEFPGAFLPRRATDGRASMSYYARAPEPDGKRPALAMLMVGFGQSAAESMDAIAALPGAISLGFSPYTQNPTPLLASARAHGHEYLVTLPMESQGYPLNDSGPHALLTGADPAANARNLDWVLSRMQGEVGLTGASDGLRGERFGGSAALMGVVEEELRVRGLIYIDPRPGTAPQPRTAVVSIVIDDPPDRASIDGKLSRLEQQARDGETVIGLATMLRPVTVERVSAWARGLNERGVALTPVSAVAVKR